MNRTSLILSAVLLALLGAGCADSGAAAYNANKDWAKNHPETPAQAQKRIDDGVKAIQNNPNMPEQAKEIAIAQLQSHQH